MQGVLKMKKLGVLFLVVFLLGWVGTGLTALVTISDLFFDLGTNYDTTDQDTQTGRFAVFDLDNYHYFTFNNVTTISGLTAGITFSEGGHAIVQQLQDLGRNAIVDDEDMVYQAVKDSDDTVSGSWELTLIWSGLTGSIYQYSIDPFGGISIYVKYDPGAHFYLWLDTSPDAYENGTASDPTDDTGFGTDTDTVQILEAELESGHGWIGYDPASPDYTTGERSIFSLKVISVIDNTTAPYLDSDSYDLQELVGKELLFSALTSASPGGQLLWDTDANGQLVLKGQGEGTFRLQAAPEPATLLLVGSSLFLVGLVARKRRVKA